MPVVQTIVLDDAIAYPVRTDVPVPEAIAAVVEARANRVRRWTKVTSISIANFKAIEETTVPLGDVTIIVGPNGCGKSSVLQAIHWAIRASSYIVPKNSKEMMSFERIDYLPSSEPLKTAHKGELRSETRTPPTVIALNHAGTTEDPAQSVTIQIWAARNKGGITAHIEGGNAVTPYKQRNIFITSYIPGLAGLSEKETILAQPLLRRQAASGDAGGVLRNILYNISTTLTSDKASTDGKERLQRLNELVQAVHPGISLKVAFDDREDYFISAEYTDGQLTEPRSLETLATGVLQVIQIFAYLVLFRPKIMLIDEPDAHLHPDKQERLIEALEKAAPEFETQIILTTHSPHIARAAGPSVQLVWMHEGSVKTGDDAAIRRLLGWGGLDKEVMFFVEDEDDKAIRAILKQWPELSRRLSVCRCFGIDNLPKDKLLQGLMVDGELRIKAILHRDKDFMTDEESTMWKRLYKTDGTFPWVTASCDVEAYFCRAEYLCALYGIDRATADEWRNTASDRITGSKDTFKRKRKEINRVLYDLEEGGQPSSEQLWTAIGEKSPDTEIGKKLFKALKQVASENQFDAKRLDRFEIPAGYEIAPDLREIIEQSVAPPRNG